MYNFLCIKSGVSKPVACSEAIYAHIFNMTPILTKITKITWLYKEFLIKKKQTK